MSYISDLTARVRRGDPIAPPISWLLSSATLATRAGMSVRKLRGSQLLDAKVVSVGNITVGGTGKTPYVLYLVDEALQDGNKVAVITRGYGARSIALPLSSASVPEDERVSLLGDESALMLQKYPELVVIRDSDRVRGGRKAIEEHACDLLILDDGFQAVHVARDEDVVLIDATNPFGNGALVPRGILREPLTALRRATKIVLTRCDLASDVDAVAAQIQRIAPEAPIDFTIHAPTALRRLCDGETLPLSTLQGQQIVVACGLGNPEAFVASLESLGADVLERRFAVDHATPDLSATSHADYVVVTEKDAIKLAEARPNLYALEIAILPWKAHAR